MFWAFNFDLTINRSSDLTPRNGVQAAFRSCAEWIVVVHSSESGTELPPLFSSLLSPCPLWPCPVSFPGPTRNVRVHRHHPRQFGTNLNHLTCFGGNLDAHTMNLHSVHTKKHPDTSPTLSRVHTHKAEHLKRSKIESFEVGNGKTGTVDGYCLTDSRLDDVLCLR